MRTLALLIALLMVPEARAAAVPATPSERASLARAQALAAEAEATPPAQRFALLVGIDDYPPGVSDLNSCVADARLMRALLVDRFGFPPANVRVLTNANAHRDAIFDGFRTHLARAGADGAAVFFFSGHGLQMRSNVGAADPEADGRDEAIYVWNGTDQGTVILDDELGALLAALPARHVLVAIDACNAGTGTRGDGSSRPKRLRFADVAGSVALPEAYAVPEAAPSGAPGDAGDKRPAEADWDVSLDGHVLLAAAADAELAYTGTGWPDRGGTASVFTYFLVSELERAADGASFAEVMERVRRRTRQHGQRRGQLQTPQLEGEAAGASLQSFLGG